MRLAAGVLRNRIRLEQATETRGSAGCVSKSWSTLATVCEQKVDLSGSERFTAQQTSAEVSTRFTIRYRTGLGGKLRVVHDSVTYNVESVQDPDGMKVGLYLMCERTRD